ncbi:MAG: site-specific integrase, partial [Actinomycetota bacterium]
MILGTFLSTKWLPAIEAAVRKSTHIGYDIHIRHHIVPYIGKMRMSQITGEKLNRLYATLAVEGLAKGTGGLAPATIRRVHCTLHRAFRDAVRWGYLKSNPCEEADPPRLRASGSREMKTWTTEELASFLGAVASDEWGALYHLIAMTGMRRGEALGLRWSDVDLERGDLA